MKNRRSSLKRRTAISAAVVALQIVMTVFFLFDLAIDVRTGPVGVHFFFECMASLGLVAGVVLGAFQIRWLVEQARLDETAVATAKGAMRELITIRFAEWLLTDAEADVALFALKGFGVSEIAELRQSAPGTVRAQLAKVYGKACVNSHVELMALFTDDLIDRFAK